MNVYTRNVILGMVFLYTVKQDVKHTRARARAHTDTHTHAHTHIHTRPRARIHTRTQHAATCAYIYKVDHFEKKQIPISN